MKRDSRSGDRNRAGLFVCDVHINSPCYNSWNSLHFNFETIKFLGQHFYSDGLCFRGLKCLQKIKVYLQKFKFSEYSKQIASKSTHFKQFREKRQRLGASDCVAKPCTILKNS